MMWNDSANQFLTELAAAKPTPGGGAAAAMAGAMGCALLSMAIGTTLKRKNTLDVHKKLLQQNSQEISQWQKKLEHFMAQDAQAYESFMTASRLSKNDPIRPHVLQEALWQAALVPVDTATICQMALQKATVLEPMIWPSILSDVYCAKHLLKGALACCVENIRINLKGITCPKRVEKLNQHLMSFTTVTNK